MSFTGRPLWHANRGDGPCRCWFAPTNESRPGRAKRIRRAAVCQLPKRSRLANSQTARFWQAPIVSPKYAAVLSGRCRTASVNETPSRTRLRPITCAAKGSHPGENVDAKLAIEIEHVDHDPILADQTIFHSPKIQASTGE